MKRASLRGRIPAHRVRLKRVYLPAMADDGLRILVDRLWPRGVRKASAGIHRWIKDAAPTPALRRWFDHEPERWQVFRQRYAAELRRRPAGLAEVRTLARRETVTLVFAARDERHSHAVVLRDLVLGRSPRAPARRRMNIAPAQGGGRRNGA